MNRSNDLNWRGRQSPRGDALDTLAKLSWHNAEFFNQHRDLVDLALRECGPDRLLAATLTYVLSAIRHEPELALEWLDALVTLSPSALASEQGQTALLRIDLLRHDAAKPLLLRLLHGSDEAMSAITAALIMVRSFEGGDWSEERDTILSGGVEWRAAAAHVAANRLDREIADAQLLALIADFFDDPDPIVRGEATDVFRRMDARAISIHPELYRRFLKSSHFDGERTYFAYRLEDAPAELDELILEMIELASGKLGTAKPGRGDLGYQLWAPLMRIYTSNTADSIIRKRCLDIMDILVANDVGGGDKLNDATR